MTHSLPHLHTKGYASGHCVCECDECLNDNAHCICTVCNGNCDRKPGVYKYNLNQADSVVITQLLIAAISSGKNDVENLTLTFQHFVGQYMDQVNDS